MNAKWLIGPHFIALIILALFATGCTKNVSGGDPSVAVSSTNGVVRIFEANETKIIRVLSNAFPETDYRGMMLNPAPIFASLVKGWHPTNGFVLTPILGPITNILLDTGNVVPYSPYFYISLLPLTTNQMRVSVKTIRATIVDGQETGIHGGWANHQRVVPGVIREEENVLSAISAECNKEGIATVADK